MRKSLRRSQVEAQRDLARALRLAGKMMVNEHLKLQDPLDAMEFIRSCSDIDKQMTPYPCRSGNHRTVARDVSASVRRHGGDSNSS